MKTEDLKRINGSGLFFFKSDLEDEEKLEILNWHSKLPENEKRYVRLLRSEVSQEAEFFAQGD